MQQLLPPKLVALLLIAMVLISLIAPWPELIWPLRVAGVLPFAIGLAINLQHAKIFDRIGTNIKTFGDPDTLVLSGAFSWTRNPMYLGFLLMLIGVGLALGSLAALGGPLLFFVAADRWYIPFEEKRLAATFGTDYDEYRDSVRRWIELRAT
jgi:protein-S-isoprenylcysteine O-methyltransferase Ste14